jgi:indolepyruvate ferredoxin oxidoreductase alpha subunit
MGATMKQLMMGNEAIGRGAVEAGVSVVSAYPGTPSSEIPAYLARIAKDHAMYGEYAANEKVALEVAIGASWAGLRALATMKHVGVNVAADPLLSLTYTGVKGGLVLVSADDPSCHSSQNEQDNRYYAMLASMPALEPASPQEALEMTKAAFDLSEAVGLPVMLRPTTRSCHCRADVEAGEVRPQNTGASFERDVRHRVTIPAHARLLHPKLLRKIEQVRETFEESPFNSVTGSGSRGIIASGISSAYVAEAVAALGGDMAVLKLGTVHPLPRRLLASFLEGKDTVLVVEEMEPVVECQVKALAFEEGIGVSLRGKDLVPRTGELDTGIVTRAVAEAFGLPSPAAPACGPETVALPPRPPVLCPGCPHRATFYCINKISKKAIKTSDIGCYTLGVVPPLSAVDTCLCMGASIGVAGGLAVAGTNAVVATIGDSTFFHTGLPALASAVYNRHRVTIVILDNRTTAMTGHQPHPGTGTTAMGDPAPMIDIATVCEAMGAATWVVDPFDLPATMEALTAANAVEGPAVVVAKSPCALLLKRSEPPLVVDEEACTGCKLCITQLGCPAITFKDEEKKSHIDPLLCTACGVCAQVCRFKAIKNE